ncbi:MAG: hemolysin III family protein [Bacilli bacterium]
MENTNINKIKEIKKNRSEAFTQAKIDYEQRKAEINEEYENNLIEIKPLAEQEGLRNKAEKRKNNRILNEAPKRGLLEEIGNATTHGIGAILAVVGLFLMLSKSTTTLMIVASCFYGVSIFIMMLMSCLYHSFKWGTTVKRIWRRFDYSSIYLLIGGTFAPMLLIYFYELHPIAALVWFIVMWVLIVTGITFVGVFGPGKIKGLHYSLYFVIGWSGLALMPSMFTHNLNLIFWILGGGVTYTLGMIPFAKKGLKGSHFIWHFFVLAGAIVHFLGIYFCIYC